MGSVSVIIPTCDRPALLRRALASVRAQTLAPAEIIVVDDGSASQRGALAGDAGGLTVLANRHAAGPSGARNAGAAAARGEWLAFLDDDDEWTPPYLAEVLAHAAAARLDVVLTAIRYCYENGDERGGKTPPAVLRVEDFLARNPGLVGSNVVIRRAAFAAVGGFDESLGTAEDMDFGIRLSLHAGLRYAPVPAPLVRHHHHGGARLCTRRGARMRAGIRRFFELHGARMSAADRQRFHLMARRLWGIDEYGRDQEAPE